MPAVLWLLAVAPWGVEVGWQPLSEGGVEYIIQLEPYSLQSLAEGQAFVSDVPRSLDVRTFRIVVGEDQLPREMPPQPEPTYNDSDGMLEGPELADDAPRIDEFQKIGDQEPAEFDHASQHVLVARPPDEQPPAEQSIVEQQADDATAPLAAVDEGAVSAPVGPQLFADFLRGQSLPTGWATGILTVLFLSIGANLFLAWIAWSERSRFRTTLRSLRNTA